MSASSSILQIKTPRAFLQLLRPARYKGAFGGRGSGKSHFFAELALERCVADATRAVCIREVQNSIKDSVRQLLIDKIASLGLSRFFDVTRDEIRGSNGSLIIFRGMNDANADNIKSLEGYDVAWVEEAHTLSQRSLDMLRPTIRKEGAELWFSWNPRNKTDPVDNFFRMSSRPIDAAVVEVHYKDNPWFPKSLLKEMDEDRARDPEKAAHVWDGAYETAPGGNYYGKELAFLETDKRLRDLSVDPALPVHTAWDLGAAGNMTTWLFQLDMGQFRWLGFFEYEVSGLPYAVHALNEDRESRGYTWGTHLWPHDGASTDVGSGERRCDTMQKLGFNVTVLEKTGVADGIEATRKVLRMSYFDQTKCEKGLEHLRGYRRKFDRVHDRFLEDPDKNGHDHAADAMRTAAMGQNKVSNAQASLSALLNYRMPGVV